MFQRALARDPSNNVIRRNVARAQSILVTEEGNALFKKKDFSGAIAKYRRALAIDPSHRSARTNLAQARSILANNEGVVLFDSGDVEGAIAKYRQALNSVPSNTVARANLSRARSIVLNREGLKLYNDGNFAGAISKYREALRMEPTNATIRRNLAIAEAKRAGRRDAPAVQPTTSAPSSPSPDSLAQEVPPPPLSSCPEGQSLESGRCIPFRHQEHGLIGGATWDAKTFVYNLPLQPTPEQRAKLRGALERRLESGGHGKNLIDPDDYDFVLGLAASNALFESKGKLYNMPSEVLQEFYDSPFEVSQKSKEVIRLLMDQLSNGKATATIQEPYNLLRNRSFTTLDCHSNGAMICLAALKNGDVSAKTVRLIGPQITRSSLSEWNSLVEKGRVGALEIFINERDLIPVGSYAIRPFIAPLSDAEKRDADEVLFKGGIKDVVKRGAPRADVEVLECKERGTDFSLKRCHGYESYKSSLPPRR